MVVGWDEARRKLGNNILPSSQDLETPYWMSTFISWRNALKIEHVNISVID